jgi:hypothetical protein
MSAFRRATFAVLASVTAIAVAGASAGNTTPSSLAAEPITAVILADESGSLTAAGVASERDAANAIVTSDLSPNSRFMIVGFGSDNGQSGQNPVQDYCRFISVIDRKARDALGRCAQLIHARKVAEGNDTDQATALQHAIDLLKPTHAAAPVIFLLTDGVLDVHQSPAFGATPERRNAEALRRIVQQFLPDARAAGIQIWPLGFGPSVSRPALERFAQGGAGANRLCSGVRAAKPHAIIVGSTGDVIHSFVLALGRARCGDVGASVSGQITTGGSRTLRVEIPPIATDGAIAVTKSAPALQVSYTDPKGRVVPEKGTFDGQQFEISGKDGRVEALRIGSPLPGVWRVKISDPRHVGNNGLVSAFAVWQGTLQASLIMNPALPHPDSTVQVELRVLSRDGIVSEQALKSANATAAGSVTDSGGTRPIRFRDDGKGVFRGSFVVPSNEKGQVVVKARVSGAGLAADERVLSFNIQTANFISASFDLSTPAVIHPGSTLKGTVNVVNQGPQRTASLRIAGLSRTALLTLTAPTTAQTLPTGQSQIAVTLFVPKQSRQGQLDGLLQLVGDGQVLGQTYVTTKVEKPKGFLDRNSWLIPLLIALIILAVLGGVLAWLRQRRRRQGDTEVRDLTATLKDRRGKTLSEIDVDQGGQQSPDEFSFTIVGGETPRLDAPGGSVGDPVTVRRDGDLLNISIDGTQTEGRIGEPIDLGEGLKLTVSRRTWTAPTESSSQEPVLVTGIGPPTDDAPASGSTARYGND